MNDNEPCVVVRTRPRPPNEPHVLVDEGVDAGIFVATVRVSDRDSGANGEVNCKFEEHNSFGVTEPELDNFRVTGPERLADGKGARVALPRTDILRVALEIYVNLQDHIFLYKYS